MDLHGFRGTGALIDGWRAAETIILPGAGAGSVVSGASNAAVAGSGQCMSWPRTVLGDGAVRPGLGLHGTLDRPRVFACGRLPRHRWRGMRPPTGTPSA